MFACDHAKITPDIMCLSKGLTGGYMPMAIAVTTQKIYDAFYDDYLKLKSSSSAGISGRKRLFIEFIVAAIATIFSMTLMPEEFATGLKIPYLANAFIPLGLIYLGFSLKVSLLPSTLLRPSHYLSQEKMTEKDKR